MNASKKRGLVRTALPRFVWRKPPLWANNVPGKSLFDPMNVLSFIVLAVAVLLLAVWSGGIVPAGVCAVAALACSVTAVLEFRRPAMSPAPSRPAASLPWVELSALAILGLAVLTVLPLPPALDAFTGATRHAQNDTVRQALRDTLDAGLTADPTAWFALTRNRAGTLRMALLWAAVFGVGSLATRLPRRWRLAWLSVLIGIGVVVGMAGYIGQWWIPQGDRLWWLFPIPHVLPGPVGCFINRNHFGGFLAMLIPVALGLAASAWMARYRLAALAALLGALAMAFAMLMSLSRGALLALAGGVGLILPIALARRRARDAMLLMAAAILMALGALSVPHPAVQARLDSFRHPLRDSSVQSRLAEWRETLRVWPQYPVIGAGANALRMVYPQHRQTASGRWLVHAENMPLELLAEAGLAGAILALAAVLALVRRARTDPLVLPDAVRLGIAGALLVAGLHALWDFAILVPVYAVTLAALIGLLLPPPEPATGYRRALRLAPALVGLLAAAWIALGSLSDLRRLDAHEALQTAPIPDLQRALVWAPTSWHAWYYLGIAVARDGVYRGNMRACLLGERFVTRAAGHDPNNYRLWFKLGEMRLALMDYDGARTAFARAKSLRPWLAPPPLDRPGATP